jgi:hydroxypyruvate isomerase
VLSEAKKIGYTGVDLADEKGWSGIVDAGLELAAQRGHSTLEDGLNRAENAARIEWELREGIDQAVKWKIPVLICFSGNRGTEDDEAGLRHCAATLSRVAPAAEQAGVTLAVELLNSKIDHPGYQADHTDWGVRLCQRVGSPAVALLYDIYHMQIMEGDLIRTIGRHHAHFAHYHTAGNPGRGPLTADQEINYPAVYRAIAATGYQGLIGHEFLPRTDPLLDLRQAYEDCAGAWLEAGADATLRLSHGH